MSKRQCKYYEVLGVSRKATIKAIKIAYRKLVKIYHPGDLFLASLQKSFLFYLPLDKHRHVCLSTRMRT